VRRASLSVQPPHRGSHRPASVRSVGESVLPAGAVGLRGERCSGLFQPTPECWARRI
jgi:hypothetical protein